MSADRPLTILIAALGGEGGGVLTDWLIKAAACADLPVQSTSIPGVAQRTGATTYYLEIWPETHRRLEGRRPVLSLTPTPGEVDLVVASELLEAGRCVAGGFVTPDRTTLIASTSRVLTTLEKMAMGDGRYDTEHLVHIAEERSKKVFLADLAKVAQAANSSLNAVLLGVIAGAGILPVPKADFVTAVRAVGKAVDANLRGFDAGLSIETVGVDSRQAATVVSGKGLEGLRARAETEFGARLPSLFEHALARLVDYQDEAYASLYLDRLRPFAALGERALEAVARNLAVRMSFEDIIRVAQTKVRPKRLQRVREETGACDNEPVRVTEFFKPGIQEIADILPRRWSERLLKRAANDPDFAQKSWTMHVETTRIGGFLKLWGIAKLRPLRRRSYRYHVEQAAIDSWLADLSGAIAQSDALVIEVAECARLIKGYGATHRRGQANYQRIRDTLVRPALAGKLGPADVPPIIAKARDAALADPDGVGLDAILNDAMPGDLVDGRSLKAAE